MISSIDLDVSLDSTVKRIFGMPASSVSSSWSCTASTGTSIAVAIALSRSAPEVASELAVTV